MWRIAGLTDVGLCKFIFFGIYIIVILKLTKSIHNFIIIDVPVSSIVVTFVVIIVIKAIWNLPVIIIEGIKNKIDIIALSIASSLFEDMKGFPLSHESSLGEKVR